LSNHPISLTQIALFTPLKQEKIIFPKFKGDGAYRDSSVSFMKFYFNVLNDDYAKVVNM
jgi:CDP-glycerol glycerophosphotransferase (TagB/SpsB family)